MPDSKITALTSISTSTDPANDPLVIVDVSDTSMAATGTTKKVTLNQLLGASGTATLASATISGDLTVDTNVLKVDTTLNRVGINNASPAQALDVAGSVYLSTNATYLYGKTSGGLATRTFGINAANDVYVGSIDQSISNIRFNSGGGDWAVLNSTGLGVGVVPSAGKGALQLSSGINFPATQVASSDANTLDDYEEGTFTPTVVGTTGAGTGTYTTQLGHYTKVGRIVTCDISLVWTAHTGTGNIDIGGLPFSVLNTTGYAASAVIGYIDNIALTAGNIPIAVLWWFNTTKIRLNQTPTGGGAAAGVPMDTAGQINLSITYLVA